MKKSEQAMVWRIHDALRAIPLPQGYGTSTASVAGLTGYVNDMREATPKLAAALAGVAMGDDTAEWALGQLESWVAARKAEDWR